VLLKHPEMFQNYILSSPAFWVNEEEIYELLEGFADRHEEGPKDVYLSMGTEEMPLVEGFSKFINTLGEEKYEGKLNLHVFWGQDEVHATNTISRLPHILRKIYPPSPDTGN
jgi:predicted alpha/beta superfamily hydrolase